MIPQMNPYLIPFLQYLYPDGRTRMEFFVCSEELFSRAKTFMDQGGWFEAEMLMGLDPRTEVSLTACLNVDGPEDIAIEICPNGPEILHAVERLVGKAEQYMKDHP